MSAEIIMFVPRPNPNRPDPTIQFDVADHLHLIGQVLDYSGIVRTQPEMPSDVGFHPTDKEPA